MKKIFALLTIVALALTSCDKNPEPEPQPEATPIVALDKQSISVKAEGGNYSVGYTIENAIEGVELNIVNDAEWIVDITVEPNVIAFVVEPNESLEAREAELSVEYPQTEPRTITINQAAKSEEPEPQPTLATIELEVSNIEWNNADIAVTPSEDIEYVLGVMGAELFAEKYAENSEAIIADRIAEWESTAKMYEDMGYDDPWQYYMQLEQREGERTYNIKDSDIANLSWGSDYVAYCFGIDDEGNVTSSVATAEFATIAPVASENDITISIDAMTKSSVEFTVTTTTNDPYYVTLETTDVLAPYADKSDEELIRYLLPQYNNQIEQRTFTGTKTITNSDLGKSVNGFKSYKVVVWGFENGPTTKVFYSEEFKPTDPVIDLSVNITIDELSHDKVTYSVVPNSYSVTYFHSLFTAEEVGTDGGKALAESLIAEEKFYQRLSSGPVQNEVVVEPEKQYYVVVFGYDGNTSTMTSEVFLSDIITTPAVPGVKPTIEVEVTNLAWNGADIYITPNGDFMYYYECRTRAKFEERYGSVDGIYDRVVASWQSEGSSYGEDWLTVMGWYTNDGYRVADIGALRWSTEYVFFVFGVNADGSLATDVVVKEFTTLTPQQSSNEFTITINSMTRSSVNFTVTPTTNDQYYVTVEKVGTLSGYGPGEDKSYDDLIDNLLPEYETQLTPRLFTGEQTISNSDLSKTVNGFSEYQIVVWGFDNGPTTTVFMSEPFRPADPE
ncbi:MAG: BACON domain-containing protein [Alistipes sp.]|nr:BACON domain-containing protein [Alistipes sp.]